MACANALRGSDLIYEALKSIDCDIRRELITNLVIDVDLHSIKLTINGGVQFEHCKIDNAKWDSLLSVCGYGMLSSKMIRSVRVNLLSEDAANIDINLLCEAK
jgi:hypothetical protein